MSAHLDLATTSAAHQAELVKGDDLFTCLADPERHEFCVRALS